MKDFRFIGIIVVLLFGIHFATRDFSNPYQRPIAGDAQAYYAYLPAIFIYHDLDYEFLKEINPKYYPPRYEKSFLHLVDGEAVNKTFPGAALLYAPFFFIAHGIAVIFDLPTDGYSNVYQICFVIGFWSYLFIGMLMMNKVLVAMGFKTSTVGISSILILLGTNIFFYSFYDQSVTHVLSFFMINAMLYCLFLFNKNDSFRYFVIAIFLLALIGITRPTNALVLILIPFFFPEKNFYLKIVDALKRPKNMALTVITGISVLLVPMLLWKFQADKWLVYGYGDERFNFAEPHLHEFLFSYIKGWFTYTPLALFILVPGFIVLFRKNKLQGSIGLAFYAICIYIFSSWWCWYYGAGMSQRVMIDHYILLAFILCILLESLEKFSKLRMTTLFLFSLLSTLNLAQAWQIRQGIIPLGSATQEQYWDNFLRFENRARVYPRDNWKLLETFEIDLDATSDHTKSGRFQMIEGEWTTEVSELDECSGVVLLRFQKDLKPGSKVIVSFDARSKTETKDVCAVSRYIQLRSDGTRNFPPIEHTYHFSPFLVKDKWKRIEFLIEPNLNFRNGMELFFWNGGTNEKVEFRRIRIEHYFSDDYM